MTAPILERVQASLERLGANPDWPAIVLEIPPRPEMGDYAFPCFQLAKHLRKPPAAIAADVAAGIGSAPWLERVEVVGGYVNFFLNRGEGAKRVVETVLQQGDAYGAASVGAGKRIVIDFSSPNIAKPFHVGHLRSTMIGHSLARIFETLGYDVVRLNYLGDWGTQFGKLIVAYRRFGTKEEVEANPIQSLLDLYVRFHKEAEEDPALEDEARAAFRALEEGREEETALWRWFRELSLAEFEKQYHRLGVHFDSYTGESAYNEKVKETVAALQQSGIARESEGAWIVELDGLPPCLIQKKDGATLYATRDIAAAIDRYETYGFTHLLYVVGAPQQLHFQQVFGVLARMGHTWVDRLEHIPFGQVRIGDEQLSTRRGNVVFLEDLLDQAVERASRIIEERNPGLEEKRKVAEAVGVGAVVFSDLFHNRIKDISFDWESVLNFEGDTGPYVQYTHARAASLLRRAERERGLKEPYGVEAAHLSDGESFELAKRIAAFPEVVGSAAANREPSEIARYLIEVCHGFNSFYHARRILGSEGESSRVALVAAVKQVLARGLYLLGVAAPEAM